MPHEQNQNGADGCGHQSAKEAEHGDIQDAGKDSDHKGPGYADKNVGENAMIRVSYLFSNPSGDCPDQ